MNRLLIWAMPPEIVTALMVLQPLTLAAATDVTYVSGSSQKLEQLIGDVDFQTGKPTLSLTASNFHLSNTDLGVPFRHKGQTYLVFGDSNFPGTADAISYTPDTDPEAGLRLIFFSNRSVFAPISIPNILHGAFDVPLGGVSAGGLMYLYYVTDSDANGPTMGRSVLAVSTNDGASFSPPLYTLSSNSFINVSVIEVNCADWPGLPQTNGMGFLIFGSGSYRKSDIYLAFQPESRIEDPASIQYFQRFDTDSKPVWTTLESDTKRITGVAFTNSNDVVEGAGELSATFNVYLKKWMLFYNLSGQIQFKTADEPWGPYSAHGVSFDPTTDHGFTNFIYLAGAKDTNLCQPNVTGHNTNTTGGVYGPYIFSHFSKGSATPTNIETTLYHTMSTWNPYNSVVMRAQFTRRAPPFVFAGDPATNSVSTANSGGADASVESGINGDLNFGTNATLAIKNNGVTPGDLSRKAYLRFPLNLSRNQRVANAALILTVAGKPSANVPLTYNVYGLRFASGGQNWDEAEITWNNAPANQTNDSEGIDLSKAIFLGGFTTPSNRVAGSQSFFSSGVLTDFLNQTNDSPVTLIITRLTIDSGVETFASGDNTNSPPVLTYVTLSKLPDQMAAQNETMGPLFFNVESAVSPASSLIVTASSSNTNLVAATNIVLGGGARERTVSITPAPNKTGTATITLSVRDGIATPDRMGFQLTVRTNLAAVLTPDGIITAGFSLGVNGGIGPVYVIQGSSDLFNWTNLFTNKPIVTPFRFVDTNAASFRRRFYRALVVAP